MNWLTIIFNIAQMILTLSFMAILITKAVHYIVSESNKLTERFEEIIDKIEDIILVFFSIGLCVSLGVVFKVVFYILN